jgi:hypothetical protein
VGFASDKTDTDGLNHGLGVGLPTLLSNAGLGSCSIIIFIFKLKHV